MKVDGKPTRTIWLEADGWSVGIIDQTALPHRFATLRLTTLDDMARAIKSMQVRGAPLIGAAAAYGMCLALRADASDEDIERAYAALHRHAADRDQSEMGARRDGRRRPQPAARGAGGGGLSARRGNLRRGCRHQPGDRPARPEADRGRSPRERAGEPVNVLTHCNAGWLATVDVGTATAPIYTAHDKGIGIHVWVDETRPRNQGASLTAWELGQHGVPHTVIADNTGGHLMQHGMVDLVIVGTDRVTAQGDVCNKIGTYLKALAAKDNNVPFYVALPSPTIDFTVSDGIAEIPIEQRGGEEQSTMTGRTADGRIETVQIVPDGSAVANYAFDVTPARLVTGLITERGVLEASREGLTTAFPERAGGGDAMIRAARQYDRGSVRSVSRASAELVHGTGSGAGPGAVSVMTSMRRDRAAGRWPAVADRAEGRARHRAAPARARLLRGQRTAAAVGPARRSRGARPRRRNLDRRDQVLGRGFPRRPEMDGLPDALRPAVLRHHGRGALRDLSARTPG